MSVIEKTLKIIETGYYEWDARREGAFYEFLKKQFADNNIPIKKMIPGNTYYVVSNVDDPELLTCTPYLPVAVYKFKVEEVTILKSTGDELIWGRGKSIDNKNKQELAGLCSERSRIGKVYDNKADAEKAAEVWNRIIDAERIKFNE